MKNNESKIKLCIDGEFLGTMRAIAAEFKECGKLEKILLSANKEQKNLKINDADFICMYRGVLNAINSNRYPNKSGNEYTTLLSLKEFLESEHFKQRDHEISL